MASFQVQPPESFDFKKPEGWEKWIRRFDRFLQISGLMAKLDQEQIDTLIYCMGDEAEDLLNSLKLTDEQKKKYELTKKRLDEHFSPQKNAIFERAKFNFRVQKEGESVDSFITDLFTLAEKCDYGDLHDELIRDRIVVGIRDGKLSERMQLDAGLTLKSAMDKVRQSESVRKQQGVLRNAATSVSGAAEVAKVTKRVNTQKKYPGRGGFKPHSFKSDYSPKGKSGPDSKCKNCGRTHEPKSCPAWGRECHFCKKKGHFKQFCRIKNSVHAVESSEDAEVCFLDAVTTDSDARSWHSDVSIGNHVMTWKIDTGADVTCLPLKSYCERYGKLQKPAKILTAAGGSKLDRVGMFRTKLEKNHRSVVTDVYVIRDLETPLLGDAAIRKLNLPGSFCCQSS